MYTLAILNNLNASSIIVLALVGLLLFGKDLPLIARKVMKEYFRYKRMIHDATSDIQREMESAATELENEKRRLEEEVNSSVPSLDEFKEHDSNGSTDSSLGLSNGTSPVNQSIPSDGPRHWASSNEPAHKPAADPLSLDVPSPAGLSQSATAPVKSPAASVAALDTLRKGVPPPSKIPPPL